AIPRAKAVLALSKRGLCRLQVRVVGYRLANEGVNFRILEQTPPVGSDLPPSLEPLGLTFRHSGRLRDRAGCVAGILRWVGLNVVWSHGAAGPGEGSREPAAGAPSTFAHGVHGRLSRCADGISLSRPSAPSVNEEFDRDGWAADSPTTPASRAPI